MNPEDAKVGARVRITWEPSENRNAMKGRVGVIKILVGPGGTSLLSPENVVGAFLYEEAKKGTVEERAYPLDVGWWDLDWLELVEETESSIYDLLMETV